MTPRRIDLHIDELVLHGLPGVDRAAVGDAVRAELERLLSAPGASVPSGSYARAVVDGGTLPGGGTSRLAEGIAGSIYRGLSR